MRFIKNVFDWLKLKKIRIVDILCFVVLLISYIVYFAFFSNVSQDFKPYIKVNLGYLATTDQSNNTYVIDSSRERILKISNNKVQFEMKNSDFKKFDLAENVVSNSNGDIYVQSMCWDDSGFLLANEKIVKFNSSGKYLETIYEANYKPEDEIDKHHLFDLRLVDDTIEFIKADDNGFEQIRISENKEQSIKKSYKFENAITMIQNFATDENNGFIYLIDRRGKILRADQNGINVYAEFEDNTVTPYSIAVGSDGSVYFSDIRNEVINKIEPDKSFKQIISRESLYADKNLEGNEGLLFNIAVNKVNLSNGVSTDVVSTIYNENYVYSVTKDGQVLINHSQFNQQKNYIMTENLIYALKSLFFVCAVYLTLRIIFVMLFNKLKIKLLYRIEFIVIGAIIVVSVIVTSTLLPTIESVYRNSIKNQIMLISTIESNSLNPDDIKNIKTPKDFMSNSYKSIINCMNNVLTNKIDKTNRMGSQIEKYENGVAYAIAYPDVAISSYYPLDKISAESVKEVYETKQPKTEISGNSNGTFIIARTPIFDSNGNIVALASVAKDSTIVDKLVKELLINIIINLVLVLVAAIFLFNEIVAFVHQKNIYDKEKLKQANAQSLRPKEQILSPHMLRLADFVLSATCYVPATFLPVYAMMFSSERLGIPKALAGSIPLFVNALFITIAAAVNPTICRRFGFKKVTIIAAIGLIISDVLLTIHGSFYLLVLALLFNGFTFGLLDNAKYYYLSGIKREKQLSMFAMCSEGSESGKFLGNIIGAFLASVFAYNNIFWASVLLDIFVLFIFISLGKTMIRDKVANTKEESNIGFFKFLFSKNVIPYVISISLVYGILSGFIYYYVPIYGNQHGLDEKIVSILLLISTMMTVFLSKTITQAIGRIYYASKFTRENLMYFVILIMLATLMIIANFDNLHILVAVLVILGIINCFGQNICRIQFLDIKAVKLYGEDKALGVYNFTNGLGKANSSIVFSSIITVGIATGMWVLSCASSLMVLAYKFIFGRNNKI